MRYYALYIEETCRALKVRMKEHLASKRQGSLTSPLGGHRNEMRDKNDFSVICNILTCESEASAKKVPETFLVAAKSPRINNRNECLSIASGFLPYVSLREV